MKVYLVALLMLTTGWAADWKDSAFPNWSDATVLRVLTDSPWAKGKSLHLEWTKRGERPVTYKDVPGADHTSPTGVPVQPGSPVGGIGGKVKSGLPDRADVILRWGSALPVRQAKELYEARQEKRAVGVVAETENGDLVLEVLGLPSLMAHQGAGSVEHVARQGVYLRGKGGKVVRPRKTVVQLSALTLTISVHFAKGALEAGEKEVEVVGDLQVCGFREKFRLEGMMYGGRLEM